ncbi:ribosomal protein L1 [Tilletiaria anomala UBC 951]|uniref:Ribosomal L1 domain-containing protein 1 n=1 Tax=Tilletiaria anomala (strain ATCC 24038 / CBS 436.72 / UBC 951) TaxID=1037660 RepID=A0A066VLU2_TILAU|nr:ribosomal protein L1 [Tilletiaria anomala UBC 951]KDN41248.1 ribosomal protein L1 [Tilletiaria anomala UBC 951]
MPPSRKSSSSSLKAAAKGKAPAAVAATPAPATPAAADIDLIDSHVSPRQAQLAFDALTAHDKKHRASQHVSGGKRNLLAADDDVEEGDGLDGDTSDKKQTVWLQVTVKQLNPKKMVKPVRIPLEHPIFTSVTSICLLTKDPQREYKDLLVEQQITSISRVVGVSKLKGKFKPFDARRQLLQDHDLFLADDRIVPLLPTLLGKKFFDSKKQPILIDISKKKAVKANIEKALSGTYYIQNRGTNTAIKLGHLRSHTPMQLVDNLRSALPHIVSRVPGKWSNIQALEVKLGASASLPIWNCKVGAGVGEMDEEGRWAGTEVVMDDAQDMEAVLDAGARANAGRGESEGEGETDVVKAAPDVKAKKSAARKGGSADAGLKEKESKARSSAADGAVTRKAAEKVQVDAAKAKAKAKVNGKEGKAKKVKA